MLDISERLSLNKVINVYLIDKDLEWKYVGFFFKKVNKE